MRWLPQSRCFSASTSCLQGSSGIFVPLALSWEVSSRCPGSYCCWQGKCLVIACFSIQGRPICFQCSTWIYLYKEFKQTWNTFTSILSGRIKSRTHFCGDHWFKVWHLGLKLCGGHCWWWSVPSAGHGKPSLPTTVGGDLSQWTLNTALHFLLCHLCHVVLRQISDATVKICRRGREGQSFVKMFHRMSRHVRRWVDHSMHAIVC